MFIAQPLEKNPEYYEETVNITLSDEIIIHAYHLNRLMNQFRDNQEHLLVKIINTETNLEYTVTIGQSHTYKNKKNIIYVPQWILDIIGCIDVSTDPSIRLEIVQDDIPHATKIVIKPLDPAVFEMDIIACFEAVMTNLHTIQQDITIPVFIPDLNYTSFAYIEKVEPANISRIVNGEVAVEFMDDHRDKRERPVATLSPDIIYTNVPGDMTNIDPTLDQNQPPSISIEETIEQRRQRVRESWIKREKNGILG